MVNTKSLYNYKRFSMVRRIFILITCSVYLHLHGQFSTISVEAVPEGGDTMYYLTDELPRRINLGKPGENQFWSFTNLVAPYRQNLIAVPLEGADMYRVASENLWKIYVDSPDGPILHSRSNMMVGSNNIMSTWTSTHGLADPSYLMDYQDIRELEEIFQTTIHSSQSPASWKKSIPQGVDSLKISVHIARTLEVDATGMLLLSGGARHQTQRVHMTDHLTKKLWSKSKDGSWQDITSIVHLDDLAAEEKESYHFTDREHKGIICSVYLNDGTPSSVDYHLPNIQARHYDTQSTKSRWLLAFPNPALSFVRFKLLDVPSGTYTIKFSNIFMQQTLLEKSISVEGNETIEIDVNHFKGGTYFYRLLDKNGKILTTKRLVVLKP